MSEFKKKVLIEFLRFMSTVISATLVMLGVSSCTSWRCTGEFCAEYDISSVK